MVVGLGKYSFLLMFKQSSNLILGINFQLKGQGKVTKHKVWWVQCSTCIILCFNSFFFKMALTHLHIITLLYCGHKSETNGSSRQKRVHLCLVCRVVIWSKGRNTAITMSQSVCERKVLAAVSIIHLQPILKEKREGAPEWNFYRLRKWIMGRVAWIKTDQFLWWRLFFFFFCVSFSARSRSREKEKQEKRWKRNEKRSTERERERKEEWGREGGKWRRNAKREVV